MSDQDEADNRLVRRVGMRLVLWSGVLTLAILLVLGAILYVTAAQALESASVSRLQSQAAPVVAFLGGKRADRPPQGFVFGRPFVIVLDARGEPIDEHGAIINPDALPGGLPVTDGLAETGAAQVVRLAMAQGVPIRVYTERVRSRDGQTYFVQAVQDRVAEEQTLDELTVVLGLGGLAALTAALFFGVAYSRRALVPIRESLATRRNALRRQREFTANASHQLRTPLSIVRAALDYLARHPEQTIGESQDLIDDAKAEALTLTSLVEDLLLIARVRPGSVKGESVDLRSVAGSAVERQRADQSSSGREITLAGAATRTIGDAAQLERMVLAMLAYATWASMPSSAIKVEVSPLEHGASIRVWSDKARVSPDTALVEEGFAPDQKMAQDGPPLQLAVVRAVAEAHDGHLDARVLSNGVLELEAEIRSPKPPASA